MVFEGVNHMLRKYRTIFLRIFKIVNVLLITATFAYKWLLYYAERTLIPFDFIGHVIMISTFMILYTVFITIYEGFFIEYHRVIHLIYSEVLSVLVTNGIMYLAICMLSYRLVNFFPGLVMFFFQLAVISVWCYLARQFFFYVTERKKTAVIWDTRTDVLRLIEDYGYDKLYEVVYGADIRQIDYQALEDIDTVFLIGIHSRDRNVIIKYCIEHSIATFIIPRVGDVMMQSAQEVHIFHLPMLRLTRYGPAKEFLFVKRTFDIIASLTAIILLSPVMIITAIAVRRDGGPAFYRQTRLTQDGREFTLYKFRSMRVDAEKDGVARLSSGEQDDRITKVGRVIRAIRLDELPQLFNILKGDMSIVGPRPERPEIAEQYYKVLPEFKLRLQAKAGLTGYAQVFGKYNTTPYDKLLMDLMYIAKPSIWQDLAIMFGTVKILFMKESTEGIQEGAVHSMNFSDDFTEEETINQEERE